MVRLNQCLTELLCLIVLAAAHPVRADEGQPVAIRYWPGGGLTIETHWNLHVGMRLDHCRNRLARVPDLENRFDELPEGVNPLAQYVQVWPAAEKGQLILDRKPDEESPMLFAADSLPDPSSSAIALSLAGSLRSTAGRAEQMILVEVDGLRLLDLGAVTAAEFQRFLGGLDPAQAGLAKLDAVLFSTPADDAAALVAVVQTCQPRVIVLPAGSEAALTEELKAEIVPHNTLALSAGERGDEGTRFIVLGQEPWPLQGELAELFARKEAACQASRQVLATLSVEQMNFRPGDGTHTPRWNAEHMMGRELGFFSQIYHALDPAIPVMDLNPKQMPDEYQAAHPDWSGAEEARQMERAEAFTRRYAYLLEGLELDHRAPGSRMWTPRSLLKQMERHYGEHADNVEKKRLLPDWPGQ
jgi:hypothetical protein